MVIVWRPLLASVALVAILTGATACQFSVIDSLNLPSANVDRQRLARATAAGADNAHAWFLQGRAALDDNKPAMARTAFRKAIAANPVFEEAHLGIALSYLDEGRWAAAAREYDAAARRFPRSAAALEGLAAAELGRHRFEAAHAAATRALALDANSPQAHRLLGEVAYARGRYEEALAHWQEAGRLAPRLAAELEGIREDLGAYMARYGAPSGS